ncbi:MAG: transglycosylase domain-containing protein [Akkermansia sp.]|nr:transglycosylase domain-containing protein [Akkermansia sp.]
MRRRAKAAAAALACALAGAAACWWVLPFCVAPAALPSVPDTHVYDRNGEMLGFLKDAQGRRCSLPQGELPEVLVRAAVAAEDRRFMSHGGVNLLALARAVRDRIASGAAGGASTITMQLCKLGHRDAPRNMRSKLREMLQARRLEMSGASKHDILRAYLDNADFGNNYRGAECAAWMYFSKPAAELNAPEAALLAAVLQAPSRLNPLRHPEAALARRNRVLAAMGEPADDTDLHLRPLRESVPSCVTQAGRQTLLAPLQQACEAAAAQEVERMRDHNMSQAAVFILHNPTGEVLACVPAALPQSPRGGALDGTRTPRSAGSTLKPFVYLQAFRHGAWPGTVMADVPTLYKSLTGVQAPTDYNGRYIGPVAIRRALACSQNIPAMQALGTIGSIAEFLGDLQKLGFELERGGDEYGLGLAIGNAHVTLAQLVRAYAALARGGSLPQVFTRLPHAGQPESAPLYDPRDCYRIADILSDPTARASAFGRAPMLTFPFRCACKTGTSSNYRDNWCVGFTREFTVGVWAGNFDNSPMKEVSGISGAGPIFHRAMLLAYEHTAEEPSFPQRPQGLVDVRIDTRTGGTARNDTPQECVQTELALAENPPKESTAYDANGRAVLDSRYAEWYAQTQPLRLYALDPAAKGDRAPSILIPANGATVLLDPNLPANGSMVELKSTLPAATTTWRCDTLRIIREGDSWYAVATPGTHTIHATDSANGLHAQSTITVRQP